MARWKNKIESGSTNELVVVVVVVQVLGSAKWRKREGWWEMYEQGVGFQHQGQGKTELRIPATRNEQYDM